jgi:phenylpropionate dioxygenase-like ring-hydroxylating dioxygenase large terminal subunit
MSEGNMTELAQAADLTSTETVVERPRVVAPANVPFAITDRSYIPRERYYDKAYFDLENERLWPRVWQMACRLEEIPNVGDYMEYKVAYYSVMVVRTSPTEIKAYQNQCRHRATALVKDCGTFRGGQIVCPFHAWRWNLDGSAAFPLYGQEGFEERVLDADDLHLVECQVGTWAGSVFINMDPEAPPLKEVLHPVPEFLDPLLIENMRINWWKGVRLNCNWKLAQEAFMEGWHVRGTHTQLTLGLGDEFPNPHDLASSYPNGHNSLAKDPNNTKGSKTKESLGLGGNIDVNRTIDFMHMIVDQLGAHVLEKDLRIAESLRTSDGSDYARRFMDEMYRWNEGAGIKLPDRSATGAWGSQWYIFPNYKLHPLYGNSIAYRARPDGPDPEHCYFEVWSLTLFPESEPPRKAKFDGEYPIEHDEWPLVCQQDFLNIERQQQGMHMPGLAATRLSYKYEDGIANSHLEMDRYLAR